METSLLVPSPFCVLFRELERFVSFVWRIYASFPHKEMLLPGDLWDSLQIRGCSGLAYVCDVVASIWCRIEQRLDVIVKLIISDNEMRT